MLNVYPFNVIISQTLNTMANKLLCILLFFLSLSFLSITTVLFRSLSNSMPFGVLTGGYRDPQHIVLNPLSVVVDADLPCRQTYGFMPCSTTALGNLFLIIVYGYLIFKAVKFLSYGSEQLEILGSGILGDIVLPKLNALPGALLILGKNFCLVNEIVWEKGVCILGLGVRILRLSWVCLISETIKKFYNKEQWAQLILILLLVSL